MLSEGIRCFLQEYKAWRSGCLHPGQDELALDELDQAIDEIAAVEEERRYAGKPPLRSTPRLRRQAVYAILSTAAVRSPFVLGDALWWLDDLSADDLDELADLIEDARPDLWYRPRPARQPVRA